MITDTTFFTNELGYALLDRFKKTLEHVQYFDVVVGYFRTSGFYRLCESFETIEKIRILVGLNVDQKTYEIIEETRSGGEFDFESHSRTKHMFSEQTASEMDESEDSYETEIGIRKFLEFLTADCSNKEQDMANGGNGKDGAACLSLPFTRKYSWTFVSMSNTLSTWKLKIKSNGH
jgi:hypothetical protein